MLFQSITGCFVLHRSGVEHSHPPAAQAVREFTVPSNWALHGLMQNNQHGIKCFWFAAGLLDYSRFLPSLFSVTLSPDLGCSELWEICKILQSNRAVPIVTECQRQRPHHPTSSQEWDRANSSLHKSGPGLLRVLSTVCCQVHR